MPPKVVIGISAPKCVTCKESVYPQEKIEYDGQIFHTLCFKCTECRSTLSLSAVAMINGTQYCKNCFIRIFKKDGRYTSFETGGDKAGGDKPSGASSTSSPAGHRGRSMSAVVSSSGSSSVATTDCSWPDCKNPKDGRLNYCSEHAATAVDPDTRDLAPLFDAIDANNLQRVKDIIAEKGVTILLKSGKDHGTVKSPLEAAFAGLKNSRECGLVMVEALQAQFEQLTTQVAEKEAAKEAAAN